jgi:hypothetical protein
MPRVALPDSSQSCRIFGCLYTPNVQYQHYFSSFIIDRFVHYRRLLHATHLSNPASYPQILDIVDLRPLRGRHAYKASLSPALPDSLQLC